MKNFPGQIWTAARKYGEDNEDIFGELGYSDEEIQKLYEDGIIRQDLTR